MTEISDAKGDTHLQAVRDSSAAAVVSAEGKSADAAPELTMRTETAEIVLREVANLESELSSLTLRLRRLSPDMEAFGEALY